MELQTKILFQGLALFISTIVLQGCGGRGNINGDDTGGRAKLINANANTSDAGDTARIEKELIKIEYDLRAGVQNRDSRMLSSVLADDIVVINPDGTVGNKEDNIRSIESGAISVGEWDIVDLQVKVLSADSALVSGYSVLKRATYRKEKGIADISGAYRFTDIFARRDGRWQIVASQATKVQNPIMKP